MSNLEILEGCKLMQGDVEVARFEATKIHLVNSTPLSELYFHANQDNEITFTSFLAFVRERIISSDRKDLDAFLIKNGLLVYDEIHIAKVTRLINPLDNFWLKVKPDEDYDMILNEILKGRMFTSSNNPSAHSPSGQNIKYFSKQGNDLGIIKKRLNKMTFDKEAEVATYLLAELFKVPACETHSVDIDHSFSKFHYNFLEESLVPVRYLLNKDFLNETQYKLLTNSLPDFKMDLARMIVFDFITYQDDRHMSNYAFIVDKSGNIKRFYELYDNGRSLFFENDEEFIKKATDDPIGYSNSFGIIGTYYDSLNEIVSDGIRLQELLNLDVTESQVFNAVLRGNYPTQRALLITDYIMKAIEKIKKLDE